MQQEQTATPEELAQPIPLVHESEQEPISEKMKLRSAAYYERKAIQGRKYYAANKEKCKKRAKDKKASMPKSERPARLLTPERREKAREYAREKYRENKPLNAEKQREYRKKCRAAYLLYCEERRQEAMKDAIGTNLKLTPPEEIPASPAAEVEH